MDDFNIFKSFNGYTAMLPFRLAKFSFSIAICRDEQHIFLFLNNSEDFYFKVNIFVMIRIEPKGPKSYRKLHNTHIWVVSQCQNQPISTVICMQRCLLEQCLRDKLFYKQGVQSGGKRGWRD